MTAMQWSMAIFVVAYFVAGWLTSKIVKAIAKFNEQEEVITPFMRFLAFWLWPMPLFHVVRGMWRDVDAEQKKRQAECEKAAELQAAHRLTLRELKSARAELVQIRRAMLSARTAVNLDLLEPMITEDHLRRHQEAADRLSEAMSALSANLKAHAGKVN